MILDYMALYEQTYLCRGADQCYLPWVTLGFHDRRERDFVHPSNLYAYVGKIILIVF